MGFPLGKTGGLIEALASGSVSLLVSGRFRWVKPAASLKQPLRRRRLALRTSFRWVKPAASLKPVGSAGYAVGAAECFRWVKPAASLKPQRAPPCRASACSCFRWVKPAASLKQADLRADGAGVRRFPLGKTGGLIEAHHRSSTSQPIARRFRWVKPAASLKPELPSALNRWMADVSAG